MASFELAAGADPDLDFLSARTLLDQVPPATRRSPNPFSFPVAITWRDKRTVFDLIPDGRPFGLAGRRPDGRRRRCSFRVSRSTATPSR
jgi:hypothetical protein